jgi:3-deoxy-D-manno-octulosonic-acid transferase
MKFLYSIGVWLYTAAVNVAALWNPKAKKWVQGRRESLQKLENFSLRPFRLPSMTDTGKAVEPIHPPLYWFHCASLGEFEQGRPLIEALKAKSDCQIAVSFFSPSGYEIRKNYELADLIFYLPVDSKKNAKKVFDYLNPTAVFFIKYEFWANYIFEAKSREIPFYSVSAVLRKSQIFFKWYGSYMRSVLKACTTIFVQNEASKKLLESIQINSVLAGDTRYDRVLKNAEKAQRFPLVDSFTKEHRIFVCGSLWLPDLQAISEGLKNLGDNWKIILTTHEIDEAHLKEAESFFFNQKIIRYSKLNDQNSDSKILLIDNVGMLMHLYGYADLAYVGGAFKTGLHNILEPASFGLPVIFGPRHEKFPEAKLFIENGIGFSISDANDFESVLKKLQSENLKEKVIAFMNSQKGATNLIINSIFENK